MTQPEQSDSLARFRMWEQFTPVELITIEAALGATDEWEARLIRERVRYEMRRRDIEPRD